MHNDTKSIFRSLGQLDGTVAADDIQDSNSEIINTAYCGNDFHPLVPEIVDAINHSDLPWQEKFLIEMLCKNGLRVSEIANPINFDVIDDKSFYIFAFKQNKFKIGYFYDSIWTDRVIKQTDSVKYWQRSRQYYYRVLTAIIPNIHSRRKKNTPVTHAMRNLKAQHAFSKCEDINDVMAAIGVSSKSAAASYLTLNQLSDLIFKSNNSF